MDKASTAEMWSAFHCSTTPIKTAPRRGDKSEENLHQKRRVTQTTSHTTTSKAPRSVWTVMGPCYSHNNIVHSLQNIKVLNLLIFVLLLSAVDAGKSRRYRNCPVDKCSETYRSISDTKDDTKKCRYLISHKECLGRMLNGCRGNLLYHTSVHVNKRTRDNLNCATLLSNLSTGTTLDSSNDHFGSTRTNQCIYAGKPKYKFCSLFGDPHVRTFSDKFHTCRANGSWPLINNDYLVVRATNSLLPGQTQATAISKLMVIIKDSGSCAKARTYVAEVANGLPGAFKDGSTHSGVEKSVNVTVIEPGKEVQIDIRFIATTIVMRHVGTHLTFSVQMPEEIVSSPVDGRHQMCVRGCPKRQRIRLSHEITRLTGNKPKPEFEIDMGYTEQEARRHCRDALLEKEVENELVGREKRSAGKSNPLNPKSKRNINHQRQNRNADPDAAATSWKQLSGSTDDTDSTKTRSSPRSKRNRNRRRPNRKNKKWDPDFLHDDPGVGRYGGGGRSGRRARDRGVVSSVGRGTNFYFEACVFDLMTTGDATYASSARGAFDDVTRFHRSGAKAKGASKKVVVSWTIQSTTSTPPPKTVKIPPPMKLNTTKKIRIFQTTDPGNGGRLTHVNIFLLLFCLITSTYALNLIHFGIIINIHNFFSNSRKTAT